MKAKKLMRILEKKKMKCIMENYPNGYRRLYDIIEHIGNIMGDTFSAKEQNKIRIEYVGDKLKLYTKDTFAYMVV